MKPLVMKYAAPAADSDEGWEQHSLPLGCGHFGCSVFGLVERERIQVTENSVLTRRNLTNAAEIYLRFPHQEVSAYERGLVLDTATAYCRYTCDGVRYSREYFTSYPDGVLAVRLTADQPGALAFVLAPEIPFQHPFGDQDTDCTMGRTATVRASGDRIEADCQLEYYGILFAAQFRLETDGELEAGDGTLAVGNATEATIYFSCGTNYVLGTRVFSEEDPKRKLDPVDPRDRIAATVEAARSKGYTALKAAHEEDVSSIFGRVSLDLGDEGELDDLPTDELLKRYGDGETSGYLEALYYQYGRYLLIASSRQGCLPANLQGIWTCHRQSPWGSGYWHNINVQMNYWPVFSTNMAELFPPYCDLNQAFRQKAKSYAAGYIRRQNPENYREGDDCGWCVGTAVYPYEPGGTPGSHSGPGTGGLTTKMYWDYWDFTRDPEVLKAVAYPTLHSMSRFLTRTVREYDGRYLASFSASPEQMLNGRYSRGGAYYHTVGCAFDQQMLHENGRDTLAAAELLGEADETTAALASQMGRYSPVAIGWSGQIKEYLEENYYGEIGEYEHRHISQLVGLMPGALITSDTPAWMDAAKVTLNERSDESTGWALAHRLNAWARTGDGDRSYRLLRSLLGTRTLPNLWDTHPPFQIDGNFGGTSGMTEMLLQSHEGFIRILPSLPTAWTNGRFDGLVARGNFTVGAIWQNGQAEQITVAANHGGRLCLHYPRIADGAVTDAAGNAVEFERLSEDRIAFDTVVGATYRLGEIPEVRRVPAPAELWVDPDTLTLKWTGRGEDAVRYNVYRNTGSRPGYDRIAAERSQLSFTDETIDFSAEDYITYKVTACRADGTGETDGPTRTICHATRIYKERYLHQIRASSQVVKTMAEL
jgi:alpha-L-fucosidase 2